MIEISKELDKTDKIQVSLNKELNTLTTTVKNQKQTLKTVEK